MLDEKKITVAPVLRREKLMGLAYDSLLTTFLDEKDAKAYLKSIDQKELIPGKKRSFYKFCDGDLLDASDSSGEDEDEEAAITVHLDNLCDDGKGEGEGNENDDVEWIDDEWKESDQDDDDSDDDDEELEEGVRAKERKLDPTAMVKGNKEQKPANEKESAAMAAEKSQDSTKLEAAEKSKDSGDMSWEEANTSATKGATNASQDSSGEGKKMEVDS